MLNDYVSIKHVCSSSKRDIESIIHDRNRYGRGKIVGMIVGKRKIMKRGGTGNGA